MKSALNAANGRANVAVEVPTEAAPKAAAGSALPAAFVAPPRTITDITAILDSEKPDPKTIEELKAEADARPTGKESREDQAQFYFDRANARVQLGRLADAIADANKAIEAGRGAVSANMMGRLISLAAQQYSAAGDPKKAFELYQRQLREIATQKGAKGYQFGANRAIAGILIQMGDIAQAEAYLRRSQPQIQEARTSGHPWRARPTMPTARAGKRKLNSAAPCCPRRAASSATPRPPTRSASCASARRSRPLLAGRIRPPSPAWCSRSTSPCSARRG